ncbi:hypothetical protein ACPPVO_19400 [Dactylosporangium sp. McL0621]|uniref:hypothetical protein n=1 Tax=Dactylosporangium sp. McL0621 TaxID=3415678 RepID=UPI003CEC4707
MSRPWTENRSSPSTTRRGWLVIAAEFPYTYRPTGAADWLSQPVLTPAHLAALAADPGFLP